jgi:phosphoglucomutase/phosphopentomutase
LFRFLILLSRRTAATFASRGIPVALFTEVVPTPFVSFGVKHLHAAAGVMVTASHNPAADNGYKVYWGNASQIIAPHDKGISAAINANLVPWKIDVPALLASSLISNPTNNVAKAYYEVIREWNFHPKTNKTSTLKIVFSAMHGVGGFFVSSAWFYARAQCICRKMGPQSV